MTPEHRATAPAMPPTEQRPRRLALSGAVNFRDLGGYRGTDGRQVRWGRIYRSDSLAELSDADVQTLSALGLRTICDLRAESERKHKPNKPLLVLEPAGQPPRLHAFGFMPHGGEALIADTRKGAITVAEIKQRVAEIYRRFVVDQSATFARLLHLIEADALPLLFHCTSGRDRTGFAAAVLLMALGVDRDQIMADYLLSDHYRRDLRFQVGSGVDEALMHALTSAHPDYMAAAFEAIDQRWGSGDAYLRNGLGLDDGHLRRLRDALMESTA